MRAGEFGEHLLGLLLLIVAGVLATHAGLGTIMLALAAGGLGGGVAGHAVERTIRRMRREHGLTAVVLVAMTIRAERERQRAEQAQAALTGDAETTE